MTTHRKILHIISIIRTAHPAMEKIYTEGGCLNFALLLHAIFPQGELYKDCDHVVCKIEGKYYDITGVVDGKDYAPFSAYYNKRRTARSFSLLLKANYNMNLNITTIDIELEIICECGADHDITYAYDSASEEFECEECGNIHTITDDLNISQYDFNHTQKKGNLKPYVAPNQLDIFTGKTVAQMSDDE